MKRLLALDQASKTTGVAVFDEDGELVYVDKFTIDIHDIGERLVQFKQKVAEIIEACDIEEVVYEDIQQQENVQTFKVLAEIYGVLTELVASLGLRYSSILATQWRSILGIKGKTRPEQKRNAQAYVLDKFQKKVTQDEADAVCIGLAYIKQNKGAW